MTVLYGVTLQHYAAIKAALAEGFELAEVLAIEGIKDRFWKRAESAWKKKLAEEPAALAEYEDALADAEDALTRSIRPLEDDPAGWISFLLAFTTTDVAALLEAHRLGPNDVARLGRRWAERIEKDDKVQKNLAELARAPRALPRIEAEPKVLRKSRFAAGSKPGATKIEAPPPPARKPRWLDAHQSILRALAERETNVEPEPEPAITEPLPPPQPLPPGLSWMKSEPRPLDGTLPVPDSPRPSELPFVEGQAAPSIRQNVEVPLPLRTAESLSGTLPSLDVPRGPALPFTGPGDILAGTLPVGDLPRGPVLPFEKAPEPAPIELDKTAPIPRGALKPALPFEGEKNPPAAALDGTLPLSAEPRGDPLPFTPKPAQPSGRAPREKLEGTVMAFEIPRELRERMTKGTLEMPPRKTPDISLEVYATLCAELAASPAQAEAIFTRYGLIEPEDRSAVDAAWKDRLRREPELYREWQKHYLRAKPPGEKGS